jgi:peptidoglycan/LPS O-acetylase OafA/YrhL
VDFFFVLSGFVICSAYRNRLTNKTQFFNFAIKRIGRIWPLHILVLLLFFFLEISKLVAQLYFNIQSQTSAFDGRFSVESFISNIFLLHSLGLHEYLTWNGPSWSISVELFAYLTFGLVALQFKLPNWITFSLAIGSIFVIYFSNKPNLDVTYDLGLFRCFAGFFLGVLIVNFRNNAQISDTLTKYLPSLEVMLVGLVFCFVTYLGDSKFSLLSPIVFSLFIYVFSYEKGSISRLLNTKVFKVLGTLSFTMYMIHGFLLTVIWRIVFLLEPILNVELIKRGKELGYNKIIDVGNRYFGDALLIAYLLSVLVVSHIVYKFFELPARNIFVAYANKHFR